MRRRSEETMGASGDVKQTSRKASPFWFGVLPWLEVHLTVGICIGVLGITRAGQTFSTQAKWSVERG
jgi:hypothetical protein